MDIFFQGVQVTIMGFIVVIVVLAFICFILNIFSIVANASDSNKKKSVPVKKEITEKNDVKNESVDTNNSNTVINDDLELIAVITAAIASQTEVSPDKLVVRSIRRVSSWNKEAVTEQQHNIF